MSYEWRALTGEQDTRPYSARDLYLSQLSDSQVMLAIYRTGYGYTDVAAGMEISGLEEEYRFALQHHIQALYYVHESDVDRDPRLVAIIEEIKRSCALSRYSEPVELGDRVRTDLLSFVYDRIVGSEPVSETAAAVLAGARHRLSVLLPRTPLVQRIRAESSQSPVLCLCGAAGIGKTTLAAQFAQAYGLVFVRATGLAPRAVFGLCANLIRSGGGSKPASYPSLDAAHGGLTSAWAEAGDVTIVIDECDFVSELHQALCSAGGPTSGKRLVFTSREPSPEFANLVVPPLDASEVDQVLAAQTTSPTLAPEILESGNPLHIQQELVRQALGSGFSRIAGPAGEALRYLALANGPLAATDLITLRGDSDYSIELLHSDMISLGSLVDDTPDGFRLVHTETAARIVADLRQSPQRFRFYAKRLVRRFEETRNLRSAYEVAALLGDGSERRYLEPLMREAAQTGDWRLGTRLSDQLLEDALDHESRAEAFHLMLSLVYPLELMGNATRATAILEKAEPLAQELGPSAMARWTEATLSSRARRGLAAGDVRALEGLYHRYGNENRQWDRARLGLELSAIYIAAKDYERAVEVLRPTLAAFVELGDEYGIDLAERNLASTLAALPGHEEEVAQLIRSIECRGRSATDSRRQRAWLCNLLVRRFRAAKRYRDAEMAANEAIGLGAALGDEVVRAVNLVNLGNVYGDECRAKLAIETYEAAAASAKSCGRIDIEGDASRLIAAVLNDSGELEGIDDRHSRARFYAEYAVGLLRGSVNRDALASAFLELGEAQAALGDGEAAATAFFDAAQEFAVVHDEEAAGEALLQASVNALPHHTALYLARMAAFTGAHATDPQEPTVDRFLSLLTPMASKVPRNTFIAVLGRHLHEVVAHVPQAGQLALAAMVIRSFGSNWRSGGAPREPWRVLYAGLVLSYLTRNFGNPFLEGTLASAITHTVEDLFVREEGDGSRVWTLVLDLGCRVAITISPLDNSAGTNLAGFALAMLLKGFEVELARELLGAASDVTELMVHVCQIDKVPPELRQTVDDTLAIGEYLRTNDCAVTRPTGFEEATPTAVFLSPRFCERISLGQGRGGPLQVLFGLTLVELTFQLLRGEVEMEAIRPKVVSLVRRTLA